MLLKVESSLLIVANSHGLAGAGRAYLRCANASAVGLKFTGSWPKAVQRKLLRTVGGIVGDGDRA